MHSFSSDVIVVGGGPCGSFTALKLAELGHTVNVFEEHAEIGVPSHCTGHLSIRGLKLLELHPLPSEIIENTFCGAVFHSPQGRRVYVRLSSPVTYAVNRVLFDNYIATMAENAGAHYFLNSTVNSLIINDGFVKGVVVMHGKTEERFSAKIVVDAEGISSGILRQAGLSTFDHHMVVRAVQVEVENVKDMETDMVEVFLSRSYAPGFYAWILPTMDGKARVGLASKTGNPRKLLRRFMLQHPTASKKLCKTKILQVSLHPITLGGPIPKTFSNGFLVVGDAASYVKPTTGGGVIFGMTCAKIAAEVASEALNKNDFSSESLREYQTLCQKALGFEIKFMLGMRRMLNALSDNKLETEIGFWAKIGLAKTLQSFGDIDFQGHSLIRALWNPRMLIAFLHFLLSYLSANH